MSDRPAFSAPLYAAVRQGAKELAQVLPAFPESVHVVEEPGGLGNLPSQEVTKQIEGEGMGYENLKQHVAAQEVAIEEPGLERE